MKVETTRFGNVTVHEGDIIHMPRGMLGFPDQKRYIILQHKADSFFYWYQSLDDPSLAFVIISPFYFVPDYHVEIEDTFKDMAWDESMERKGLELYVVVKIPKGQPQKMTANLIGPILINTAARQAVQMVLPNTSYSHQFPILPSSL